MFLPLLKIRHSHILFHHFYHHNHQLYHTSTNLECSVYCCMGTSTQNMNSRKYKQNQSVCCTECHENYYLDLLLNCNVTSIQIILTFLGGEKGAGVVDVTAVVVQFNSSLPSSQSELLSQRQAAKMHCVFPPTH